MSKKPSCCSGPQPQPCCGGEPEVSRPTNTHQQQSCCAPETCCPPKTRVDVLFWGCLLVVLGLYGVAAGWPAELVRYPKLEVMAHAVFHTVNAMWWGVLAGAVFVGVMSKVPREFVMSVLGQGGSMSGILRATGAGVLLDLCSHGILLVAAKLYERGASAGQVIAFLLASPWNSFSLTLVLVSLIGLYWTLTFIVLSMLIAWVTGWVFDRLVHRGVLPSNPNRVDLPPDFQFWAQAKIQLKQVNWSAGVLKDVLFVGIKESKMTVRWLLLGIVLSAVLKLVLNPEQFQSFFGPTLLGLLITLGVATVLEVCSEGATPIAADILTRAQAPGNAFAFLMAGVATDYTEVMVLRETTKSWKLALFLPLITVPQVIVVAWIININI